ncbi:MAG: hypothetical protein ACRBN8_34515 [Nannocystales bacterium]
MISIGVALSFTGPVMAHSAAAPAPNGFDNADAEALYLEGLSKFDVGDFEGALEKVEASLAIESTAMSMYAQAQSLNKLGRCREAVPIYNELLGMLPENSVARPVVVDALVSCAARMAEEDEAVVTPPVDLGGSGDAEGGDGSGPVDDQAPRSGGKKWFVDPYAPVLIGVGAIGVGVGGYFLGQASQENSKPAEQYDEFEAKGERVRQLRVQGGVILGVGGALVLTGAIRYAVLGIRNRRSRTAFTPLVGPRLTGASFSGRF